MAIIARLSLSQRNNKTLCLHLCIRNIISNPNGILACSSNKTRENFCLKLLCNLQILSYANCLLCFTGSELRTDTLLGFKICASKYRFTHYATHTLHFHTLSFHTLRPSLCTPHFVPEQFKIPINYTIKLPRSIGLYYVYCLCMHYLSKIIVVELIINKNQIVKFVDVDCLIIF